MKSYLIGKPSGEILTVTSDISNELYNSGFVKKELLKEKDSYRLYYTYDDNDIKVILYLLKISY
jgi:hypothetical protein